MTGRLITNRPEPTSASPGVDAGAGGRARDPIPVSTVRLGVLGCAAFAAQRMLPAFARTAEVRLAAVASRSQDKARDLAGRYGAEPVVGYDRLLDREDVIAVYVPLPNSLHAPWIEAALRAGKHVLAEKPLTGTWAESARLYGLARSRGLVLQENVLFPHHSQHATVRELVAGGAVGNALTFTSTFSIPPRPDEDIRYRRELGGGALFDIGGYPIRAALHFFGQDLELVGATLRLDPHRGVDVGGCALLRGADGVSAQLAFGMDGPYRTDYEICGTGGRIRLDRAFTPPAEHQPQLTLTLLDGQVDERRLLPDDQCANAVRAFAQAVLAGAGRGAPSRMEEDSLRTAALLDQIRRSAR